MTGREKLLVFYIDDDPIMIDLVRLILDAERYEVVGAADGRSGLAMMLDAPPDLVLLDLMLPDIGGWAVYQKIKEDTRLSELPVIIITAQNSGIDRMLGEHIARVQVYLTKPFSPQELRTAVEAVLKQ